MKNHLLKLSDSDLAELGSVCGHVVLRPPHPGRAPANRGTLATEVASALDQLLGEGYSPEQFATVTDLVSRSRGQWKITEDPENNHRLLLNRPGRGRQCCCWLSGQSDALVLSEIALAIERQ